MLNAFIFVFRFENLFTSPVGFFISKWCTPSYEKSWTHPRFSGSCIVNKTRCHIAHFPPLKSWDKLLSAKSDKLYGTRISGSSSYRGAEIWDPHRSTNWARKTTKSVVLQKPADKPKLEALSSIAVPHHFCRWVSTGLLDLWIHETNSFLMEYKFRL